MTAEEKLQAILALLEPENAKCWSDDPNFCVDDYAGGNEDDAFYGGQRDGQVQLSRLIREVMVK